MFTKVFFVTALAIASVAAKPGLLGAPVAYSAPAIAYTAGYANVGDSAVVTSHNSQVINPAYAAYTAGVPLAYAAAPAFAAAPYAAVPYAAGPYAAYPYAAYPYAAAHLAYSAPLAAKYVL